MSRLALAVLLAVVLLAGALYWLTLSSSPPGGNAASAPAVTDSAEPQPMPQSSAGEKPEADNSFIVCPGNPRCP